MIRDIQNVQDDVIVMKRAIKQRLISDIDVLEALHNPEIDIESADEFLDNNIYGFLRIPNTQDTIKNFICFSINDRETSERNIAMKIQEIRFLIICHLDDMKTEFGIDRHDLISYLIRDLFNWTDMFSYQFKMIYNHEGVLEGDYFSRELKFEATKTNALYKAKMENRHDNRN